MQMLTYKTYRKPQVRDLGLEWRLKLPEKECQLPCVLRLTRKHEARHKDTARMDSITLDRH